MRCPKCTERNSVASRKCTSCGEKFARKPIPIGFKLAVGGVAVAVTVSVLASSVVPRFIDPAQNLARVAKRLTAGPKNLEDAKKIRAEFDQAVSNLLIKYGTDKPDELTKTLQELLPNTAFEVHVIELPRGLRLVEIDTLLQASDFLVMKGTSGTKVFPLPELEVFDDARILEDSAGPMLALLGHSGGPPPHRPKLRTYALLPDHISDETDKLVPSIKGEGIAKFAKSTQDVYLDLSLTSMTRAENVTPTNDRDETIHQRLVWKDAKYILKWDDAGGTPARTLYTLAQCLRRPELAPGNTQILGAAGAAFVKGNTSQAPIRATRTATKTGAPKYELVTADTKYIVELKQSGNVWAVAGTKSEAYTPVAEAPAPAPSAELTQTAHAATLSPVARPVAVPAVIAPATARVSTPAPASRAAAPAAQPFSIPIGKRDVVIVPGKTVAAAAVEKKHVVPSFILNQPSPAVGRPKEQPVILSQPSTGSAPTAGATAANKQTKIQPSTAPQKVAVKPTTEKKPEVAKPEKKPDPLVATKPATSGKAIAHGEISTNLSAQAVRLRSAPSTSGVPITEMPRGTAVEILSKENGWYKVRSAGKEGYVFAGLVDCKREQAYTTAVVTKNKHITNSSGRRRVGAPAVGDRVIVLGGIKNNKYKVQLPNGRTGYVDKDAVDVAVEAPEFVH